MKRKVPDPSLSVLSGSMIVVDFLTLIMRIISAIGIVSSCFSFTFLITVTFSHFYFVVSFDAINGLLLFIFDLTSDISFAVAKNKL